MYWVILIFFILWYLNSSNETLNNCQEKNILYVRLMGGLGNRLFQIASGYSIAKKNNMNFKILKNDEKYINFIQSLDTNSNIIEDNIQDIESKEYITYHENEEFKYNNIVIDQSKTSILLGYFQSEQYFKEYRLDILKMFKEPEYISSQLNNIHNFNNLIAIHVRLGDFLLYDKHFMDLTDYYKTAIDLAKTNLHHNIEFIIISNESHEKILEYYPFLSTHSFLQKNKELRKPEYDLYFMSRCRGVICPNSTFAWWGAWLNKRHDKFVTLPKNFINTMQSGIPMDNAIIL